MKKQLLLIYLLSITLLLGCHYTLKMEPAKTFSGPYQREAIPVGMSLYLSPELKSYIWIGRPLNFETKAYRYELPLGPTLERTSVETFKSLFSKIELVDAIKIKPGCVGVMIPTITNYYFGIWDRVRSAGELRSFIKLNVKLIDDQNNTIWETEVEGVGKKRMTHYIRRANEYGENLPFTTRIAIEDAFEKLSQRITDSQEIRTFALNTPPKTKTFVIKEKPKPSRLYVTAYPYDARIRILNIKPVYKPGIELEKGRYLLEASKSGYVSQKKWITIAEGEEFYTDFTLEEKIIPAKKPVQKVVASKPKQVSPPPQKMAKPASPPKTACKTSNHFPAALGRYRRYFSIRRYENSLPAVCHGRCRSVL